MNVEQSEKLLKEITFLSRLIIETTKGQDPLLLEKIQRMYLEKTNKLSLLLQNFEKKGKDEMEIENENEIEEITLKCKEKDKEILNLILNLRDLKQDIDSLNK
jgi:hypothetical protein